MRPKTLVLQRMNLVLPPNPWFSDGSLYPRSAIHEYRAIWKIIRVRRIQESKWTVGIQAQYLTVKLDEPIKSRLSCAAFVVDAGR